MTGRRPADAILPPIGARAGAIPPFRDRARRARAVTKRTGPAGCPASPVVASSVFNVARRGAVGYFGRFCSAVVRQVDLEVGQVDRAVLHPRVVADVLPAAVSPPLVPVGVLLHLPLAFDAVRRVRQGVQAAYRDLLLAPFTK